MLEAIDIRDVEPYEAAAAYEWVTGTARFGVDPATGGNDRIVDLNRAARNAAGEVEFGADVRILRPTGTGNGRLLFVVANRGASGGVPFSLDLPPAWSAGDRPHPGDGFLLQRGWTIAWCGWQWDVLRETGGIGLTAPLAEVAPGWMRLEFRPDTVEDERPLSDSSVVFQFTSYPTVDVDDPEATLTVRTSAMGEKEPVPRHRWSFTDRTHVALEGGFQPFHWYELVYRTDYAPVVGTGLLAVRDLVAHLRPGFDAVLAYGVSQSGRFLRQFLFEGLNIDEQGRKVFDGVFSHVASSRRGEFNLRYGQPSLTHPLGPGTARPTTTPGCSNGSERSAASRRCSSRTARGSTGGATAPSSTRTRPRVTTSSRIPTSAAT